MTEKRDNTDLGIASPDNHELQVAQYVVQLLDDFPVPELSELSAGQYKAVLGKLRTAYDEGGPPQVRVTLKGKGAILADLRELEERYREEEHPFAKLQHFTASHLESLNVPLPTWIIQGILPEGLSMLVAKPKVGKTFLAQNFAVALATGGKALGSIPVNKGRVCFLALEGSVAGQKRRYEKMLMGKQAPSNLHLVQEFPPLDLDGIQLLYKFISLYPDTCLIIIDTHERVRNRKKSTGVGYADDVNSFGSLANLCKKTSVSVLVIHHTNKRLDGDSVDLVSGTTGLTAAVDNILLMNTDPSHGQGYVRLHLTPREEEETEYILQFESESCTWNLVGESEGVVRSEPRKQILDVLANAEYPLGPKEIARQSGASYESTRYLLGKMLDDAEVARPSRGKYSLGQIPSQR